MKHYKPSSELQRTAEENENNAARLAEYSAKMDFLREKIPGMFFKNMFIGKRQAG